MRKWISGANARGKTPWGVTANKCGISFVSDENALELDGGDDCITL